jgi:hypothetical protein
MTSEPFGTLSRAVTSEAPPVGGHLVSEEVGDGATA